MHVLNLSMYPFMYMFQSFPWIRISVHWNNSYSVHHIWPVWHSLPLSIHKHFRIIFVIPDRLNDMLQFWLLLVSFHLNLRLMDLLSILLVHRTTNTLHPHIQIFSLASNTCIITRLLLLKSKTLLHQWINTQTGYFARKTFPCSTCALCFDSDPIH